MILEIKTKDIIDNLGNEEGENIIQYGDTEVRIIAPEENQNLSRFIKDYGSYSFQNKFGFIKSKYL